jgi:hypothetical protein
LYHLFILPLMFLYMLLLHLTSDNSFLLLLFILPKEDSSLLFLEFDP